MPRAGSKPKQRNVIWSRREPTRPSPASSPLLWRGSLQDDSATFEGVALYWHLVDAIWIVLLPLLYLIGRT
jgi:hypothetical protein